MNVTVYNQVGNEGIVYTAPSPFDEPTKPIDVQTLRPWWMHQRHETHSTTSDAAVTSALAQSRGGRMTDTGMLGCWDLKYQSALARFTKA